MRRFIDSTVTVENKEIKEIHETLKNTGNLYLERKKNHEVSKEIINILNKYNLIADNDDLVEISIVVKA